MTQEILTFGLVYTPPDFDDIRIRQSHPILVSEAYAELDWDCFKSSIHCYVERDSERKIIASAHFWQRYGVLGRVKFMIFCEEFLTVSKAELGLKAFCREYADSHLCRKNMTSELIRDDD